ncbi:MAG: hypothetical protein WKG01_11075 [Kofleriaceae bacterium]
MLGDEHDDTRHPGGDALCFDQVRELAIALRDREVFVQLLARGATGDEKNREG